MIYLNRYSGLPAFSSKREFRKTRLYPDARMVFLASSPARTKDGTTDENRWNS